MSEELQHNYWRGAEQDVSGIKFRLEGTDVIQQTINQIRGGLIRDETTKRMVYNTKECLMNETGVSAVKFYLHAGVNKVIHLTDYNETRIMKQMKPLVNAFLEELTLNMKMWGPILPFKHDQQLSDDEIASEFAHGFLKVIKTMKTETGYVSLVKVKVKNKSLLLQGIENSLLQSMYRSKGGKEAQLTAPNVLFSENQVQQEPSNKGFGFFGRRKNEEAWNYG